MHNSEIYQYFQEHLKKIFENFQPKKSNFFKFWVVSNFGTLDFSNSLMNQKTQENGTYPRYETTATSKLSLKSYKYA